MNDSGETVYDIGGVEMTEAQANENAEWYEASEQDYENEYEDSLPSPITESLNRINSVLGGGAADFIASELLGVSTGGGSRMNEVLAGTNMERVEIESHTTAVMIDLAQTVGMNHDMLMNELNHDIHAVRQMGSPRALNEMHEAIASAIAGHYHGAMSRWDKLRTAMAHVKR